MKLLSNLEHEVLDSLIEGFKTRFPVQKVALFLPQEENKAKLIYPNENFTIKNSFINDIFTYYNEHEYTAINFFPSSSYWKSYELNGIETILEHQNLKRDEILGLANFVFPIKNIPVVGLLINPFVPKEGVITREIVKFSDKDQKRLEDFLQYYKEKVKVIELAKSEATIEVLEELFSFPKLMKTNHLDNYEAESFLEQKDGKFGGDFIESLLINKPVNNEVIYFLGDVSGHSIYESKLNYSLRNSLLTLTLNNISKLNHLMDKLNLITIKLTQKEKSQENKFVTAFTFKADKQGNLFYSSAGHKGYVLRNNGSIDSLENDLSSNFPLGFTNGTYTSNQTKLSKGDIAAVWSDGYYEIQNSEGELLGNQRVIDCLKEHRKKSLNEIIFNLEKNVKQFSSYNFNDDRSILLVRYLG